MREGKLGQLSTHRPVGKPTRENPGKAGIRHFHSTAQKPQRGLYGLCTQNHRVTYPDITHLVTQRHTYLGHTAGLTDTQADSHTAATVYTHTLIA